MVPTPTQVHRFLAVTYCDDVRTEAHNKISFMGVYQHQLLLQEFPARLLKLCVVLQMLSPKTEPFVKVRLSVFRGDEMMSEVTVEPPPVAWEKGPSEGYLGAVVPFVFENLEFSGPEKIRVRATFDENEVVPGPSLLIEKLGSYEATTTP